MPRVNIGKSAEQIKRERLELESKALCTKMLDAIFEYGGRNRMTRNALATYIGVDPKTLYEWDRGKAETAQFTRLVVAAKLCGFRLEEAS